MSWATDTYDAEGERVGEVRPLTLGLEALRELTLRFAGEMDQVPPIYSAKKIGGVAAHTLARAGAVAVAAGLEIEPEARAAA